ncbi:MAG: CaiB/BaiF CoA-transferase family protein [Bacteroidota bacterium]
MKQEAYFKDLLVIELASVLAGPAVGMFFAELGARVIKIENQKTGGDVTRSWKLPVESKESSLSAYYHSVNWGKESLMRDLTDPVHKAEILQLISQADIVLTNFKAGSDKKLGFDYESLTALNPALIYGMVVAYEEGSPKPGFDAMIQAETGWIFMNGEAAGNPVKMPVALMDVLSGHQLKQGILLALLERQQTGKGKKVSVSLFDTGVASLANQASNWLNLGILPKRKGSQHPNIAPYGDIFYTSDQMAIILGTGTQRQFEALCDCLNLAELKTDPRFLNNTLRLANRPALNHYLEKAFSLIDYSALNKEANKRAITLAPINSLKEVFDDPLAKELILTQEEEDGSLSKRVKTVIFKISD